MRHHRVHRVVEVLDEHLPVALVQEAQAAAGDLELALGRAVGEVVDRGERVAEVARRSRGPRRSACEDEAAVALARASPAPGPSPPRTRPGACRRSRSSAGWRSSEPSVLVGPGVVRAAEELAGVAGRRADDARALVRAAVHQHAHAPSVVAHDDQRLAGDLDGDVVAGVRHLARRGRRRSRCWRRSAPARARTPRGRCRGRGARGRAATRARIASGSSR